MYKKKTRCALCTCVYNVWNYENVTTLFNRLQIVTYFNFIKVSSDDLENKMAIVIAAGAGITAAVST